MAGQDENLKERSGRISKNLSEYLSEYLSTPEGKETFSRAVRDFFEAELRPRLDRRVSIRWIPERWIPESEEP